MPKQFKMEPLGGVSLTSARPGESVSIATAGFLSCVDGDAFFKLVEGIGNLVWSGVTLSPSCVDHLLLTFDSSGDASLFVNELSITLTCQTRRAVEAGQQVRNSDIADVTEMNLGTEVASERSFLFMFSHGWRRGLFFDFGATQPKPRARNYNLSELLASYYCVVGYQQLLALEANAWQALFAAKLFPFAGLSPALAEKLILYARQGWDLDELSPEIIASGKEVAAELPVLLASSNALRSQLPAIRAAASHLQSGDHLSAAYVLFPQLESVMRAAYLCSGASSRPTHNRLIEVAAITAMSGRHRFNLLQVEHFEQYLKEVMFVGFDWQSPSGVSRHTIGHGVVNPALVDEKEISLAFLTIHHLLYSLRMFR